MYLVCQVRVTITGGDSGPCCLACVTCFERSLTALNVESPDSQLGGGGRGAIFLRPWYFIPKGWSLRRDQASERPTLNWIVAQREGLSKLCVCVCVLVCVCVCMCVCVCVSCVCVVQLVQCVCVCVCVCVCT